MYTWGYLKNVILSKLDVTEADDQNSGFTSEIAVKFPYYANEAMTQICSAVKPKRTFAEFIVTDDRHVFTMPNDFVSFGDDINTLEFTDRCGDHIVELHDGDIRYLGYNKIFLRAPGKYSISYNARWFDFSNLMNGDRDAVDLSEIPLDILDAIPLYVAAECWKIDDQYRASALRNEFEIALSRIDDVTFRTPHTIQIGGDW